MPNHGSLRRQENLALKSCWTGKAPTSCWAGYPHYRLSRISSLLRRRRWGEARELARSTSGSESGWKLILRGLGRLAPDRVQAVLRHALGRDMMPLWLSAEWCRAHGVRKFPSSPAAGTEDMLRQELYWTLTETSLPQLLHYEDRNSMSYSIESRVPFLTPELARFVFSLPEDYLLPSDGTSKAVFRKAMRGIVPDAILDRRDKLGFPTPERDWLLSIGPWVERVLSSETAMNIPAFEP